MLPIVFIVFIVIIIGFIAFSITKKSSGDSLGEHNNDLPPHGE